MRDRVKFKRKLSIIVYWQAFRHNGVEVFIEDKRTMNEMMSTGIELMVIGMGIVFLFLAMLVVVIDGMFALITRYLPQPTPELVKQTYQDNNPQLIAAISSAVHHYREKHRKL